MFLFWSVNLDEYPRYILESSKVLFIKKKKTNDVCVLVLEIHIQLVWNEA